MRHVLRAAARALGAATLLAAGAAAAQTPASIKIGYAISRTGPNAGGASTTVLPNYELWVAEVNAAGGLKLGDKRVPIEVISYDDRSSSEEAVRAIERLISQDKVDLVLPPFGTGLNLAVGPALARAKYPHIAVSAITDRAPELAKRWPTSFWMTGTSSGHVQALADVLGKQKAAGKIGGKVAMVAVADGFGIDLSGAARTILPKAGFELVYDKSYPVGTQDMSGIVNEIRALAPDVFVAFSYPPDTLQITDQSRLSAFNPKMFVSGIGTTFPLYKQRFGPDSEGVIGLGGADIDNPGYKAYAAKLKERMGKEPERSTGGLMGYAALEMLGQAIERVGRVDRDAIVAEMQRGTFDTMMGRIKLEGNLPAELWYVGQWQNGEFVAIAPTDRAGAKAAIAPKQPWGPRS